MPGVAPAFSPLTAGLEGEGEEAELGMAPMLGVEAQEDM